MNYLGPLSRVFGNLKGLYSGINGATLTGAIDVVVVEQEDGTYKCSPFHVRFGKLGVLRSREKVVDIEVNGFPAPIRMKLGDSGEAFFVEELDVYDEFDENLATSPIPQSSPQHSDNDNTSRRNQRRGTQESDDLNLDMIKNVNVNIAMGEEEMGAIAFGDEAKALTGEIKADDPKSRKKRRKRRPRNHGSRSDITVTAPPETQDRDDAIFKMDEDFAKVSEALNSLDLSVHGTSMAHSRSFHRDFYSDTEVDATSTPQNSRPSTPIQSDSEYEINKIPKEGEDEEVGKWPWGELPSPGHGITAPAATPMAPQQPSQQTAVVKSPAKSSSDENPLSSDDESRLRSGSTNRSMLAGMFSFMKRNPGTGNNALDSSGIYLDDLNLDSMDPEKFALYFPNIGRDREYSRPEHDEDVESGKGSSLPQSPQPGSSPRGSQLNVYIDDRQRQRENSGGDPVNFESISLCGVNLGLFEQSEVTYDQLIENPEMLLNAPPESIVVKIEGKLVPWSAALPQLLSTTFFKRPLPTHIYQKLVDQYMKKEEQPTDTSTAGSNNTSASTNKEVTGTKRQGSFWGFSWRRSQAQGSSTTTLGELPSSPESVKEESNKESREQRMKEVPPAPARSGTGTSSSDESEGGGGLEENKSGRNSRKDMHTVINIPTMPVPTGTGVEKFKKTLRLNTDQIKALGLKYGQNEAVFSVTTAYQGTSVARCHIYLWKYDDRVVVSDIDGTITKSDVLGHILPIIGTDWSQSGVAQLFTQIQDNGYKLLYLSSRAIGQAGITRDYLRSIKQDDVTLPDGPLLLNPTSLMSAFHREVIEKKPEEFKIACLKDIQLLFPKNPFYAGYGNRINDVWAYRAVDIAIPRIFTINHRGELRHALTNTFQSSYTSLLELAEHIFPPYKDPTTQSHCQTDGFSAFEFWREQLPLVPALGLVISDQISSGPPERKS